MNLEKIPMLLDLNNPNESEIEYKINNFPDGHKHIQLYGNFNKYQKIDVKCRICNGDDLFLLMQVADIVQRNEMEINELFITYLFTARCDRVFSIGEAFDLQIVGNSLRNIAKKIKILDLHSDRLKQFLDYEDVSKAIMIQKEFVENLRYSICFPDEGAWKRYGSDKKKEFVFEKIRKDNGKIEVSLTNMSDHLSYDVPILVVDDLCDGGGTFLAIENWFHGKPRNYTRNLFVTHAIQKQGIERVAAVYDKVYITNSYKNWEDENLPINVKVIKI